MTFSDTRIAALVKDNFTPVWESVSPVTTAIYDLGEGKNVKATVGGEIAIYFCRPDGKVFDILPGLQSPKITYEAIQKALAFYQETKATDQAIVAYHEKRLENLAKKGIADKSIQVPPSPFLIVPQNADAPSLSPDIKTVVKTWQGIAKEMLENPQNTVPRIDPKATKPIAMQDPSAMLGRVAAKAVVTAPSENIIIIEPRGIDLFGAQISAALSISEPKTPEEWKKHIFEIILGQPLEGGGEIHFDIESDTASLSLIQ